VNPLRSLVLAIAGNDTIRHFISTAPLLASLLADPRGRARTLVARFVPVDADAAVSVVAGLVADGVRATVERLGEPVRDRDDAERAVRAHLRLLDRLHAEDLSAATEVSVRLAALGGPQDGALATDNAWRLCAAAEQCGVGLTLDTGDHPDTGVLSELRHTWPWVGAVARAEQDVEPLAVPESRVRLGRLPGGHQADLGYVRAANALLAGGGTPVFATHDPRLLDILVERARWYGLKRGEYEFELPLGVRVDEQRALAGEGETVRVRVPFGPRWYGHLLRVLASRS
jgi:proline dehydrogenase